MRWVEHVIHLGCMKNANELRVRKSEGKNQLGYVCMDGKINIKMNLKDIILECGLDSDC
jgi:hypothetical protein